MAIIQKARARKPLVDERIGSVGAVFKTNAEGKQTIKDVDFYIGDYRVSMSLEEFQKLSTDMQSIVDRNK